jgi:hypothetical protein
MPTQNRVVQLNTGLRTVRTAAVVTNTYVATTVGFAADVLEQYNAVLAVFTVAIPTGGEIVYAKPQWSFDNSVWYDEQILVNATSIVSNELIQTAASRVISIDASVAYVYTEVYNRLATYFRLAVKSSAATSTSTLKIQTQPQVRFT